jgi:hypothetical protein
MGCVRTCILPLDLSYFTLHVISSNVSNIPQGLSFTLFCLAKAEKGRWENIGVAVTASVTLEDLEHHVPVPLL